MSATMTTLQEKRTLSFWQNLVADIREKPEFVLAPAAFIVVVGGWELAVRLFHIPKIVLPPPSQVAVALYTAFRTPAFLHSTWVTLYETLFGFALGAVLGLFLGVIISQFKLLESTLYPYVVAFQTLPKVSIAPIIVIWFGYGLTSKVVITATMSFFPLLANTIAGLRATHQDERDLLTAFTASKWQLFWMLKMPTALPYIFVGFDLAIILAVIGAIVGEFVGSFEGLGYLILQRTFQMDVSGMFAIFIVLSVLGTALHLIVQFIQRKVVFWTEVESERVIGA
jgi:NitT/TauT family transport system permease protein